jgi:hypothetical protein
MFFKMRYYPPSSIILGLCFWAQHGGRKRGEEGGGRGVRVGTNKTESYRKAYTTSHLLRPRILQSF